MPITGTIADNLRIAAPAVSEAMMWEALHIACLDERIRDTAEQLDTWLSSDGGFLSGGERKRLALARAILARGPWLLLDEPIEGLDDATAALAIDRLSTWLEQTGAGLILVSHRTLPVQLAGEIMTIDDLHLINFGQLS